MYIASKSADITINPRIANFKSFKEVFNLVINRLNFAISCCRQIANDDNKPLLWTTKVVGPTFNLSS